MDSLYDDLPAPKAQKERRVTNHHSSKATNPNVGPNLQHIVPISVLRKRKRPTSFSLEQKGGRSTSTTTLPKQKPKLSGVDKKQTGDVFDRETREDDDDQSDENMEVGVSGVMMEDEYDPMRPNDYSEMKKLIELEGMETGSHDDSGKEEWELMWGDTRKDGAGYTLRTSSHLIIDEERDDYIEIEERDARSRPDQNDSAKRKGDRYSRQRAKSRSQVLKPDSIIPNEAVKTMMQKMGWQRGKGLGLKSEGRVEPIDAEANANYGGERAGLGRGRQQTTGSSGTGNRIDQANAARPASRGLIRGRPGVSRVIMLSNMVEVEEVDDSLESETREECEKFGAVDRVVIDVAHHQRGYHAVRVFVAFKDPDSSAKALLGLNGRSFGGRIVRASFFPERQFASGNLIFTHFTDDLDMG